MEFVKDSDYIAIRNLKQILATNEKVAKEIREGTVTPSQGKAIISCSNANIKAIQLLDLENRRRGLTKSFYIYNCACYFALFNQ